jgi:hypothetical protein
MHLLQRVGELNEAAYAPDKAESDEPFGALEARGNGEAMGEGAAFRWA